LFLRFPYTSSAVFIKDEEGREAAELFTTLYHLNKWGRMWVQNAPQAHFEPTTPFFLRRYPLSIPGKKIEGLSYPGF
jgi:hypothetical protein